MDAPKPPPPLPPQEVVVEIIQQQQQRSTVPNGSAPKNNSANVPQQIPTQGSPVPSKPSATTGPGGPGISIPKVGKSGK